MLVNSIDKGADNLLEVQQAIWVDPVQGRYQA